MCSSRAGEVLIATCHQQRGCPRVPMMLIWCLRPGAGAGAHSSATLADERRTHRGSAQPWDRLTGERQTGRPTGRPRCVTARGRARLPPVQRERLGFEQEGRPPPTGPWVPGAQPAGRGGGAIHAVTVMVAWSARAAYPPRTDQGACTRSLPVLFRRRMRLQER